jgi:molybdate transport system regulatory protein
MNASNPGAAFGDARICPSQRIWLSDDGTPVFGAGIRQLLVGVESTGSLRRAASDMGMAYSKAWQIVRRAEEHLGFDLLVRKTGGTGGGGSAVSEEGKWLAVAYGAFVDEADALLGDLFAKHFGEWNGGRHQPRVQVPREPLVEVPAS